MAPSILVITAWRASASGIVLDPGSHWQPPASCIRLPMLDMEASRLPRGCTLMRGAAAAAGSTMWSGALCSYPKRQ
ncbi:hypothetical protein BT67DRAFT_437845 [Trichocladium antarcticum]|uniref:Uncharacterized protein n=1 Tax=Trichocladium antarcticum TaxID=1450529 RepID=A0AAN6ZIB9_9PEZI|nr:hypothetical protein BT67DRAFT_437845 [Trichocladium antarcticum]